MTARELPELPRPVAWRVCWKRPGESAVCNLFDREPESRPGIDHCIEVTPLYTSPRVSEGMVLNERDRMVVCFALAQFARRARDFADGAAQDKAGRYFAYSAPSKFLQDAEDAERLEAALTQGVGKPVAIEGAGDE